MMRTLLIVAAFSLSAAVPSHAQTRLSFGAGLGRAGSTESSLSDGKNGTVFMGQIIRNVLPFVGIGAEFNRWSTGSLSTTFATGVVQVIVPLTGFRLKAGAGYGTGDPDGLGKVSGTAIHLGAAYDFSIPGAPVAITLFSNALLAHASSRSLQMVDGGLALTLR